MEFVPIKILDRATLIYSLFFLSNGINCGKIVFLSCVFLLALTKKSKIKFKLKAKFCYIKVKITQTFFNNETDR